MTDPREFTLPPGPPRARQRPTFTCAACGIRFLSQNNHTRPNRGKFCSRACMAISYTGRRAPLYDRFWAKVSPEPNSGCWLWAGSVGTGGYGQIWNGEKQIRATHAALALAGRPLSPGKVVCHHCDNPFCVTQTICSKARRPTTWPTVAASGERAGGSPGKPSAPEAMIWSRSRRAAGSSARSANPTGVRRSAWRSGWRLSMSFDLREMSLSEAEAFEAGKAEGAPKWRPIETAPRTEMPILLVLPEADLPVIGFWSLWNGYWTTGETNRLSDHVPMGMPTHWMPLPEPPHAE